jgi:hypothetical protein
MRAALDPFADVSVRSVGVPDSFGGDTLKHTNTMEITVMPDMNGEISFLILPSVSSPLLVLKGLYQSILVPVVAGGGTNTVTLDAAQSINVDGFNSCIPWPTWAAAFGAGGEDNLYGPYNYKSQRIVSQGLEWRYTGTELSDKGVCTAAMVDAYLVPGYVDKPADPGFLTTSGIRFIQRADINNLLDISQSSLANQPRYVQQTMHSAEGAGGMLVLTADEEGWNFKPTIPGTALLEASDTSSDWTLEPAAPTADRVGTIGLTAVAAKACFPIIPWQNLRPVGVSFTGLDTTISLTLRLKQRVEGTVAVSSPFQQFTDKSPREDQHAISMVANVQKTLPIMVPVTMNGFGTWWKKIMGGIGSVGKILGGIGIPMVSPIAQGVGGLADVLGSL